MRDALANRTHLCLALIQYSIFSSLDCLFVIIILSDKKIMWQIYMATIDFEPFMQLLYSMHDYKEMGV